MKMAYNYEYPYTDPYRYNADWMARIVKECQDSIKNMDDKLDQLFDAIEEDVKEYLDEAMPHIVHPYVMVDDFGAYGDGEHDDTMAIRNAISYAKRNNKYVMFTAGKTYLVNDVVNKIAIRVPSNMRIVGNGATIKAGSYCSYAFVMTNDSTGQTGGYGANTNITIEGLNFDASNLVTTVIGFSHCSNIVIDRCRFTNSAGWHFIELNAVSDASITRCKFTNCNGSEATEMVQLDCASGSGGFPAFGPYDNTFTQNTRISNCLFGNYSWPSGTNVATSHVYGIGNHTNVLGYEPHQIIITNCCFENLAGAARFVCLAGCIFADNTVNNCYLGFNGQGGGRLLNVNIENNIMFGHTANISSTTHGRGINLGNNTSAANTSPNQCIIANNTVLNFVDYGIAVNGTRVKISNNVICNILGRPGESDNTIMGRGIAIGYANTDSEASGNYIRATNEGGIFLFNDEGGANIRLLNNNINSIRLVSMSTCYLLYNVIGSVVSGSLDNVKHAYNIVNGATDTSNF